MRNWLASFEKSGNTPENNEPIAKMEEELTAKAVSVQPTSSSASAGRFDHIKQLVKNKGPIDTTVGPEPVISEPGSSNAILKSRFCARQPIPRGFQHYVKNDEQNLHLVVSNLGPSRSSVKEYQLPKDASLHSIINRLRKDGFGDVCGFRVQTQQGEYEVEPIVPKTTATVVNVTDEQSSYDIRFGYSINQDERLIDFYNRRFAGMVQVKFELFPDFIRVEDTETEAQTWVEFKRTLKIPDDGHRYELPPLLASYPLLPSKAFSTHLPTTMVAKGGAFFPMLQREAFTVAFSSEDHATPQFAVRIFTGSVNSLTGQVAKTTSPPGGEQDYVVPAIQKLVLGYRTAPDEMRQFVAMPMGEQYSVESQLTFEEYIGGIQLEFIPRLRESGRFSKSKLKDIEKLSEKDESLLDYLKTPRQLGLRPGQRLFMGDTKPWELYEFSKHDVQMTENLIVPDLSDGPHYQQNWRMSLARELYDNPEHKPFDISTTLFVSAVRPIQMRYRCPDGKWLHFNCSPYAKLCYVHFFLRPHVRRTIDAIVINGIKYPSKRQYGLVRDLNLPETQEIQLTFGYDFDLVGAGGGGKDKRAANRVESGWDMGIAMGGRTVQSVEKDEHPELWNWEAARIFNVQILNAVAFRAATGLLPPICPISFSRHAVKSVPAIQKGIAHQGSGFPIGHGFVTAKSISQLDGQRGTTLDVVVQKDKVVICVCCESNIADTILETCGHVFCRRCIGYYMTDQKVVTCAFCQKLATKLVRFSAPAENEITSSEYAIPERNTTSSKQEAIREANGTSKESEKALDILDHCIQNGTNHGQLYENIERKNSGVLQLLLGQVTADPSKLKSLKIGSLVFKAMQNRNREAWKMLIPLYQLVDHPGLRSVEEKGVNIYELLETAAFASPSFVSRDAVIHKMGMEKYNLLLGLEIFQPLEADWTSLRVAVGCEEKYVLPLLIELCNGKLPTDTDGETVLHSVEDPTIAQILLDGGAPITALDGDKDTPIIKATAHKRIEVLQVMVKHKNAREVLNHYNKFGKTAIHYAVKGGTWEILVKAGADPDLPRIKASY